MPSNALGGGGGGPGLEIVVVQALPVYQEDISVQPTFYFRRSDNTYHQAFEEALAADEDASMTRNVLAQANITGNATWRGTVDNLNDVNTPVLNDGPLSIVLGTIGCGGTTEHGGMGRTILEGQASKLRSEPTTYSYAKTEPSPPIPPCVTRSMTAT